VKSSWLFAKLLLAIALIFVGLLFIIRLSGKAEGVSILAFENDTGETKYSGSGIADSLRAELTRIQQILSVEHKDIRSESMRAGSFRGGEEKFLESIKDIGTVGEGEAKLSIGALVITARRLWPFGDPGIIISGNIEKLGNQIPLVAFLEHDKKVQAFELTHVIESENTVPEMTRDLAYQIAKTFGDTEHLISAKTFEAFKYFTEALNSYDRYQITVEKNDLENARAFCTRALMAEPNYAKIFDLLKHLAVAYNSQTEYEKSVDLLDRAITLEPKDPEVWNLLGLALASTRDFVAAQQSLAYARELSTDPNDGRFNYTLNLGFALYYVQRYDEAAHMFSEALKIYDRAEAHAGLGDCLFQNGDHSGASREYENAIQDDSGWASPHVDKGDLFLANCDYDLAAFEYNKALELDPHLAAAYNSMGNLYLAQNDLERAGSFYDMAQKLAPRYSSPHVGKAVCGRLKRGDAEAIKELNQAIEIDPNDADPHNAFGDLYFSRGEYDKAVEEYRRAIDLKPNFADPYISIADILRIECKYRECTEALRKAYPLWKQNPDVYCAFGRLSLDRHEREGALTQFELAIQYGPKNSEGYTGRGDVFHDRGDYADALNAYKSALAQNPYDYNAHCGQGDVYLETGQFIMAQSEFKRAIKILPRVARAHIGLGDAYYSQGRFDRANKEYSDAALLAPGDWNSIARLADCAWDQKEYDKAAPVYRRACDISPSAIYPRVQLVWLLLKTRFFEEAEMFLGQAMQADARDSSVAVAAGAVLYRLGNEQDAEQLWKAKLSESHFDSIIQQMDRVILLYSTGDRTAASEALQTLVARGRELPLGALYDELEYVTIMNEADPLRFASLQDMLIQAINSLALE
jgi:tetratricopeptide (TPR) repeat protein